MGQLIGTFVHGETRRAGGGRGVAHARVVLFTVREVEVVICCVLVRCVCTVNKFYVFGGRRYSVTAGTRRTTMGGSYRGAVARPQYKNTVGHYGAGHPWVRSYRVPVVSIRRPNIPCRPSDTDSRTRGGWQIRSCRNEGTVKRARSCGEIGERPQDMLCRGGRRVEGGWSGNTRARA